MIGGTAVRFDSTTAWGFSHGRGHRLDLDLSVTFCLGMFLLAGDRVCPAAGASPGRICRKALLFSARLRLILSFLRFGLPGATPFRSRNQSGWETALLLPAVQIVACYSFGFGNRFRFGFEDVLFMLLRRHCQLQRCLGQLPGSHDRNRRPPYPWRCHGIGTHRPRNARSGLLAQFTSKPSHLRWLS